MALNKEVIEASTKMFNHQHIKNSFSTKPMCMRDTNTFSKFRVDSKFVVQGMVLCFL